MAKADDANTQSTDNKTTATTNDAATQSADTKSTVTDTTTQTTDNKTTSTAQEQKLFTIESLKEEFNIKDSVFAAIKVSKDWAEGKQVLKDDFKTAVDGWLEAPISTNERKEVK